MLGLEGEGGAVDDVACSSALRRVPGFEGEGARRLGRGEVEGADASRLDVALGEAVDGEALGAEELRCGGDGGLHGRLDGDRCTGQGRGRGARAPMVALLPAVPCYSDGVQRGARGAGGAWRAASRLRGRQAMALGLLLGARLGGDECARARLDGAAAAGNGAESGGGHVFYRRVWLGHRGLQRLLGVRASERTCGVHRRPCHGGRGRDAGAGALRRGRSCPCHRAAAAALLGARACVRSVSRGAGLGPGDLVGRKEASLLGIATWAEIWAVAREGKRSWAAGEGGRAGLTGCYAGEKGGTWAGAASWARAKSGWASKKRKEWRGEQRFGPRERKRKFSIYEQGKFEGDSNI